jgi:hypothetical protein
VGAHGAMVTVLPTDLKEKMSSSAYWISASSYKN